MGQDSQPGFSTAEGYRQFAWRCGHEHDRPAVPDPVDRLLVAPLRAFFQQLCANDPGLFARLNAHIAEEALELDDWEIPSRARLWFLGSEEPPSDVCECLEDWHQGLEPPGSVAFLPNNYTAFDDVRADKYRDLRVISHWYLSDEGDESGEAE